jgi:hypothetical protein
MLCRPDFAVLILSDRGPAARASLEGMRLSIGFKIFSIAIGLLVLMVLAALLGLRMTRTVDDQLRARPQISESVIWFL